MKSIKPILNRQADLIDLLLVTSLALVITILYSLIRFPEEFHFFNLNDQINYITTARNLLDQGRLDSSLIYIGTLTQDYTKNTFYMPGFVLLLAVSFRLFGFGVFQSQLPSLLAYISGGVLTFCLAKEHFGRRAGWFSAVFFLLFPLNIFYSFLAMPEMVFITVSLLAFYLFTRLSLGRRWLLGPVLVAIAFLIRETAALLILPMALYILWSGQGPGLLTGFRSAWKEALGFIFISILVLTAIYLSPLSSGRISLFYSLRDLPLYDNFSDLPGSWGIRDLIGLILKRAVTNLRDLPNLQNIEILSHLMIASGIMLTSLSARFKKNFHFAIASIFLYSSVLGMVIFLYELAKFRGIRTLLFTGPYAFIGWGAALAYMAAFLPRKLKFTPWVASAILISTFSIQAAFFIPTLISDQSTLLDQETITFIEKLNHNDQRVLVAPIDISVPYVNKHYPVRYSFIPTSPDALALLMSKYVVGTLVYPAQFDEQTDLHVDDLYEMGFTLQGKEDFRGDEYLIFKYSK